MNRKFRAVGLAAVAVLAMTAVMAVAAQASFTATVAPTNISAHTKSDVFTAFGSSVECTGSFKGTVTAKTTSDITITPTYTNCKYGIFPATVDFTGCDYTFKTTPNTVDIVCPEGKRIDITVYASHAAHTANTPICHLFVKAQGGLKGHKYANRGKHIDLSGTVEGIHVEIHRTSAVCPSAETINTEANAKYHIQKTEEPESARYATVIPEEGTISVDP